MQQESTRQHVASNRQFSRGVLLVGPLPAPPLVGGVEVGVNMLLNSKLARERDMRLFNTWRARDPSRSMWERLSHHVMVYLRFVDQLVRRRPAIVHVKTSSGINFYQNAMYVFIARSLGLRVMLQIHSGYFPEFYRNSAPMLRALIRATLRSAHRLVVLSQSWADIFADLLGERESIVILPNGVRIDEFFNAGADRRRFRIPADRVAVLFMGTRDRPTEKAKGLFELIDAIAQVRVQHPQVVLVVAGNGSHQEEIKAILGEEGAAWINVGVVTGEAKACLYRSVDVFALPSHYENMPNSLLEAMAAGLPAVATPVGAVPEMVREGKSGFLVPLRDAGAIAERLRRMVIDPELRKAMGTEALSIARGKYDFSVLEESLSAYYQDLSR